MLRLKPLDTLFFRDGRPFTMEEDTWANVIFPPLPPTIYGALRTVYIAHNGGIGEFKKEGARYPVGSAWDGFLLRGLFLEKDGEICFPLPLDLVKDKESSDNIATWTSLKHNLPFASSNVTGATLFPDSVENAGTPENSYLDEISLADYLNLRKQKFYFLKEDRFIKTEPKVGIKLSRTTGIAQEGHLYRVGTVRLKESCTLLVDIKVPVGLPDRGLMRIGGEGKAAAFEKVEKHFLPCLDEQVKATIKNTGRFKLYFATPAVFPNGWLPGDCSENEFQWVKGLLPEYGKCKIKLLAAAVGRPVYIGGWDLDTQKSKPMRLGIPAGSVYYFELLEGEVEQLIATLHGKNISELAEQGLGLVFMGGVR